MRRCSNGTTARTAGGKEGRRAMRRTIRRKLEAQRRAQAVCAEIRDTVESTDGGRKTFAKLNGSIDAGDRLSREQQKALHPPRAPAADCRLVRQTLHDLIKAIVDVSAVVTLGEGSAKIMRMPTMDTNEGLQIGSASSRERV